MRRRVRKAAPVIDRPGGTLPSLRTTYPAPIARRLHELAESNPSPEVYYRERARILADA